MKRNSDRRDFVKKLGLFSSLCLTGIDDSLASGSIKEYSAGFIIKAQQGETRYIGNVRKAQVIIKIAKSPDYTPEISLLSELITPGDGIPVHKHLNEEEFLFIQKGKVEITLGEATQIGEPGDLIYVPKNTWHGIKNKSKANVIMLFGYSPSGFEDYFRAIGTPDINQDLGFSAEDWNRTNKKYGVVYKS